MTYRLSRQAKSDIKAISPYTIEYFGEAKTMLNKKQRGSNFAIFTLTELSQPSLRLVFS